MLSAAFWSMTFAGNEGSRGWDELDWLCSGLAGRLRRLPEREKAADALGRGAGRMWGDTMSSSSSSSMVCTLPLSSHDGDLGGGGA